MYLHFYRVYLKKQSHPEYVLATGYAEAERYIKERHGQIIESIHCCIYNAHKAPDILGFVSKMILDNEFQTDISKEECEYKITEYVND